MASTAREGSRGEYISHFTAVRFRVVGSGNLVSTLLSLDDVNTQSLVPLAMQAATNRQPDRLANFNEQRAALKVEVSEVGEWFRINRIILFSKPIYTGFPG